MSASSRNTRFFGVARGSWVRISVILRPYACIPTLRDILSTSPIPQFSLPARKRIFHPFVPFRTFQSSFFFIFHLPSSFSDSIVRGYFVRLIGKIDFRFFWRTEINVSARCSFIAKLTSGNAACSRVVCDTLLPVSCESKYEFCFHFASSFSTEYLRIFKGSSKVFCLQTFYESRVDYI